MTGDEVRVAEEGECRCLNCQCDTLRTLLRQAEEAMAVVLPMAQYQAMRQPRDESLAAIERAQASQVAIRTVLGEETGVSHE